jgi:hypothetical protein
MVIIVSFEAGTELLNIIHIRSAQILHQQKIKRILKILGARWVT